MELGRRTMAHCPRPLSATRATRMGPPAMEERVRRSCSAPPSRARSVGSPLPAVYDAQADLLKDATAQDHRIALGVGIGLAAIGFVLAIVFLRGLWMFVLGLSDLGRGPHDRRSSASGTDTQRTHLCRCRRRDADHVAAWVTTAGARQASDVRITVATHVGYVRHHRDDRARRRRRCRRASDSAARRSVQRSCRRDRGTAWLLIPLGFRRSSVCQCSPRRARFSKDPTGSPSAQSRCRPARRPRSR